MLKEIPLDADGISEELERLETEDAAHKPDHISKTELWMNYKKTHRPVYDHLEKDG